MIINGMKYILPAFVLTISVQSTFADSPYYVINNEYCPYTSPDVSWRNYFRIHSNKTPNNLAIAGLYFLDDRGTGEFWEGKCYSIYFNFLTRKWIWNGYLQNPDGHNGHSRVEVGPDGVAYHSWRDPSSHEDVDEYRFTSPYGDPANFKLSIPRARFTFNEAGELYHPQYGLIGSLQCHAPWYETNCAY